MNGNKFATGQILKKTVEVVKGRILAGWAQKSPKPWFKAIPHPLQSLLTKGRVKLSWVTTCTVGWHRNWHLVQF